MICFPNFSGSLNKRELDDLLVFGGCSAKFLPMDEQRYITETKQFNF